MYFEGDAGKIRARQFSCSMRPIGTHGRVQFPVTFSRSVQLTISFQAIILDSFFLLLPFRIFRTKEFQFAGNLRPYCHTVLVIQLNWQFRNSRVFFRGRENLTRRDRLFAFIILSAGFANLHLFKYMPVRTRRWIPAWNQQRTRRTENIKGAWIL